VVFFATWCGVCEMKLPVLARALEVVGGDIAVVSVSVDEPSSFHLVDGYLERVGFDHPTVRATDFPRFATAYDPLATVPAVAVVGQNGFLVDYQLGYGPSHPRRLLLALRVARDIPRDAPPLLSRPPTAEPEPPPALDPVDEGAAGTELDSGTPSR
jgi:thiol-disulfide isomerase/thioredoxin